MILDAIMQIAGLPAIACAIGATVAWIVETWEG